MMKTWKRAKGIIAATLTPFDDQGQVNLGKIPQYIEHLAKQGIDQVFVNGTAAECMSLTLNERMSLAEAWIIHGRNKLTNVIIHCGAGNMHDTITLAKHAQSKDAHAIAVIAPTYFKPQNCQSLVDYLGNIADNCTNTPFLYYHFPGITSLPFRVKDLLPLFVDRIANFVGVKFTSTDLFDANQCVRAFDHKYDVIIGAETMLLGALAMGVQSAIGVSFSVLGKPCNKLVQHFDQMDMDGARKNQAIVQDLWSSTIKSSSVNDMIAVMKYCTTRMGLPVGKPRLPIQCISASHENAIDEIMNEHFIKQLWMHDT